MSEPSSSFDPVAALAGEFAERYRRGERPSLTEYTTRYPELAEQIRELFPALVVMEELGSVDGPRTGPFTGTLPGKVPEHLGDYRILREVGRGGMGVVYEAVQESLGRHVALKVLAGYGRLSPTYLERFRREARAAARLHHTNIVPVHGVGESEGVHFYAMQFIQGQGLDEVLQEVKRLRGKKDPSSPADTKPGAEGSQSLAQGLLSGQFAAASAAEGGRPHEPSEVGSAPRAEPTTDSASGSELTAQPEAQYFRSVAQMGVQIAEGLDYAHKQGILHRDVKPSNLLLDAKGTVWVTDFGLAKEEGSDELTHTGDIVGTVRYMAPERFGGWSDPRSDVYGLGVTLYELLTLRPAFEESNRHQLIERVTHEDPPRPRKVDRLIPRDLETIVLKAIEKEPGRRYQTAAELAGDLGRFLAGEPVRARRIGVWERGVKWVKRRPAVAGLLAVSAAATLALIAGTLFHNAQLGAALQGTQRELAKSKVKEAQGLRNGGLRGRRFDSLEALKKAAELFRELDELDEKRTLELRNEAIACLVLADLKPGKAWIADPGWSRPDAFDPTLQYYVVHSTANDHPEKPDVRQGQLSIRRVADDQEVALLPGFGLRVARTQFSPNSRYLAAHYDQGGRHNYVWDLSRREAILKVPQGSYLAYPSFSPDSRLVALSQPDKSIRIYELPSGETWKDLSPGLPGQRVHFHPDGRQLAVVSKNVVQLRDLSDGKELAAFKHSADVIALAWRSDGIVFATGCSDHNIYLWNLANSDQPLRTLKGHLGSVVNLAFSHGGDLLFSNSWDSTDRLWDPMGEQVLLRKPGGIYREHLFGPDDQRLDHGWQVATGHECRTFHGPKDLKWVAISPRGRLLASASAGGVQLWDLAATREGDKELATLPVGLGARAHFDPKSESLITACKSAGLQRWPITPDPQTGGLQIGPPQPLGLSAQSPLSVPGYDPDVAISPDGQLVAHSPLLGQIILFGLKDPRRKLVIESPALRHAFFSSDGRWLATGNWQGRGVKVWDTETGMLAHDLDVGGPEDNAAWPAFSPDGKWLVIGTFAEYSVWEVGPSWQKKYTVPRENAGKSPCRIVFSPDGKLCAVLHSMTEVRLVNPATGREFARLPSAGHPFCFSPDGSQLVTYAGRDGAFQVWDLRLIRQQLGEMGLDWDLPPYPPPRSEAATPLRVKVLPPEPLPPSKELDAEAYFQRGLLLVQLRHPPTDDFNRARALNPKLPRWDDVLDACAQVIERDPEHWQVYHWRACAHEQLGQWAKAIADHSQAIKRAPQAVIYLVLRGRAYLHTGQEDKAEEDFRKAGEQQPHHANTLAIELVTSPNLLDRERSLALELAQQATRQAPAEASYWNTLGAAYYRAGECEAAIKALDEAEKLARGKYLGFNAYFRARCHERLGDPAKAREHHDRAVRWYEDNLGKLSKLDRQELKALRAVAEALGTVPPPGP